LTAISLSGKAEPDEKLHMAFKMYDYNHNGRLENPEVAYILKGLRNLSKDTSSHFDLDPLKWDKEQKGFLTEDDFVSFVKSEPIILKYYLDLIKLHD
jgi:Ca2+-binding EF-hand superfamily protein